MTSHTHRKDDSMTETPLHTPAEEARLDLIRQVVNITKALFGSSTRTTEEIIALVEFVEAARKPSGSGMLVLPSVMFETDDLSPEAFATMTGRAVPPGTPGASSAVFEWPIGDVQTVDNNVGDGSDVDTDVWPAAVPPPDYDNLDDDGQGERPVTYAKFDDEAGGGAPADSITSITSDDAVSSESTDGKDD